MALVDARLQRADLGRYDSRRNSAPKTTRSNEPILLSGVDRNEDTYHSREGCADVYTACRTTGDWSGAGSRIHISGLDDGHLDTVLVWI
jgi:hypothetical protein